ncbi:hypothetical protein, partial [Alloprevotella tannerae]
QNLTCRNGRIQEKQPKIEIKKGQKKVRKQGFLRRKICCRLPKIGMCRLKIRPQRAEMEKIFPKLRPNGATKPFLPPKTAPPLPRIKMPYI